MALRDSLRVLANEERQHLSHRLRYHDPSGRETMHRDVTTTDRREQDLEVAFQHVHLPLLEDAGVITYDRATGTIERGPISRRSNHSSTNWRPVTANNEAWGTVGGASARRRRASKTVASHA